MVVQAEAGPVVLRSAPDRAETAFDTIAGTGRDALDQLRRTLAVMKEDGEPRTPQPTIGDVPALTAQVSRAGLKVTCSADGDPQPLLADCSVAAYRIAQEALTNVVKHAGARNAEVRLHWSTDALVISIVDDGHRPAIRRKRAHRHPGACRGVRRNRRCGSPPRRHRLRGFCAVPADRGDGMTIRVVVADDQELVRAGFLMILAAQPDIEVVPEAGDGFEALGAVREHEPDVVLLDIRMPGMDGIQAARVVCDETRTRVIMLTTFGQDDYVFEALRAGASGFLLKDVRRDDLVHAVRVVAAGESLLAPAVTRSLIAAFTSGAAPRPLQTARLDVLTARECETLRLLARGLSNVEIAEAMVVSDHTVKTHVSNVLGKLGLRDRAQAVIAAYETGLSVPGRMDP